MTEKRTTVINLFGGPGTGKSTMAAGIFYHLKKDGQSAELVREFAKNLAWSGRDVKMTDQIYLLGKQSAYESRLYGKVDYLVTDSPVLLAGFYGVKRDPVSLGYVDEAARAFYWESCKHVDHVNILLGRTKPYEKEGRWETEAEAKDIDQLLMNYLSRNGIRFVPSLFHSDSDPREIIYYIQNK